MNEKDMNKLFIKLSFIDLDNAHIQNISEQSEQIFHRIKLVKN